MVHIGHEIQQELRRQERSVSWFARKLACDRSNVYRIFEKTSIDTSQLARICCILRHDFFQHFTDDMRDEMSQLSQHS